MGVVKAVSEDLAEVKDSVGQYAAPISKAGGALKSTLKEIDEITDEMAESAITGVSMEPATSGTWPVETIMNPSFLIDSRPSSTPSQVTRTPTSRIHILQIVLLRNGRLGWQIWILTDDRERYLSS